MIRCEFCDQPAKLNLFGTHFCVTCAYILFK